MFSSEGFIIADLTFKSFIYFEFIFLYGVREHSSFILLHVPVQFSQGHLLKRLSHCHCRYLSLLSQTDLPLVLVAVQSLSCVRHCNFMDSMPGFTVLQHLLEFTLIRIVLVMPSHHLLCHSLLFLPLVFPIIRIYSNESALCIRWPKYWSFSFNISLSNEHSGFISFKIDWFDLLAVEGTLKSLLQKNSLKASILQHSVFFLVQLSHHYMTTGKTIAFTIKTFVGTEMSLLFNILSRFIIAFIPRSRHLLIS